jgi:hypothetical protein
VNATPGNSVLPLPVNAQIEPVGIVEDSPGDSDLVNNGMILPIEVLDQTLQLLSSPDKMDDIIVECSHSATQDATPDNNETFEASSTESHISRSDTSSHVADERTEMVSSLKEGVDEVGIPKMMEELSVSTEDESSQHYLQHQQQQHQSFNSTRTPLYAGGHFAGQFSGLGSPTTYCIGSSVCQSTAMSPQSPLIRSSPERSTYESAMDDIHTANADVEVMSCGLSGMRDNEGVENEPFVG